MTIMAPDSNIIDRIYEAALLPELWTTMLDELSGIAGAQGALLHSTRDYRANRTIATGVAEDLLVRACEGDWWTRNTRGNVLMTLSPNEFHSDADHYTPEQMAAEPIYRDLLWPSGLGYAVANHVPLPNDDVLILSIEKARDLGPVSHDAVKHLTSLRPHIARSAMLASRLAFERIQSANEALGMTGLPAAVVDESGRIIDCNSLFEGLTDQVLISSSNKLRLLHENANHLLDECLSAFRSTDHGAWLANRSLALPRSGDRNAAVLHLMPVKGRARDLFTKAAFFVILTPIDGAKQAPTALIRGLFDLTTMEARVAQALAGGKDIGAIALAFGISRETVRQHLKNIFAKTGFSRQTDLAAAISLVRAMD
jgi:DNA-binding CsgD family transcriptional regulator/PAS domain-containing protein